MMTDYSTFRKNGYYYHGGRDQDQHCQDTYRHLVKVVMRRKFEEAVRAPDFAYTRFRANVGVTAYRRDPTSPTGVLASASVMTLEEAAEILDRVSRPFPLSPTEGLNKSGANADYTTRY